jgi:ribosome-associated heat shock protein Hsp15
MSRKTESNDQAATPDERIDTWLWAARFFKSRSMAAEAVDGGKVDVNGERVRKSRRVAPGDVVSVRRGAFATSVTVRGLRDRRGTASEAALMYDETPESKTARENLRVQLSSLPVRPHGEGRPTKRERRQLNDLRRR